MNILDPVLRFKNHTAYQPDFNRLVQTLTRKEPGPVPVGELFADFETVGNFLKQPVLDYATMAADPNHKITFRIAISGLRYLDQTIKFCLASGWDYAYTFSSIPFPGFMYKLSDNTSQLTDDGRQRYWVDDNHGPIQNWDDFERYPWPGNPHNVNLLSRLMAKRVPDGMKALVIPGGVFEWASWLMGLTPFCYAIADQPDLVTAIIEKVSDIIYAVIEDIIEEPGVGGIFMGDDLGFSSGTMISPRMIRKYILPQTKRFVDLVHHHGKPFLYHSCGNLEKIMDDIIATGIDAKHSFEDKIMPVEEAYSRWSDRIGIIGGVDMHLLASGSEADVRKRTREILDVCGANGRYVLGTGNSVANYLPLENYFAMLDEGKRWNMEHFGRER